MVLPRFWPIWLRTAVRVQGAVAAILFAVWAFRAAVAREFLAPNGWEVPVWSFGLAALISSVWAARRWWGSRALLSIDGIHWPHRLGGRTPVYIYWNSITVVQRRHGWTSGKWLRVVSEYGNAINLPERPADFDGFREAVERLAGEVHPLARALAEIAEEG